MFNAESIDMLKKITFTPDHIRYDTLAFLHNRLTKAHVSLNFLRELNRNHIERPSDLFILPFDTILRFKEYKATDIHYLLDTAEELGIKFGALPEWYNEAASRTERAETLRFLNLKLNEVRFPHSSPSLNRDQLNFLQEQGIDRVYQFLLMNKNDLPKDNKLFYKKIIDSYDYFIERNELEDFKVTLQTANH